MLKKTLFFIFSASLFIFNLNGQNFQWAAQDHWYDVDGGRNVCADNSGCIYVAGDYENGSNHYDPNAPAGSFISKYSSQGILLWSVSGVAGSNGIAGDIRMTLDKNGMPVITGLDSTGYFIARYDLNGFLISKVLLLPRNGNLYDSHIKGIATDSQGNFYLTGFFLGAINFGNSVTLTNNTNGAFFFVAKYSAAGTCIWAKQNNGGEVYAYGATITVDNAGNPLIAGDYMGTLLIGNTSFPAGLNMNGFLVKFDSSGNFLWAQNIGNYSPNSGQEWVWALCPDNKGNVYAVGYYDQPLTIGNTTLSVNGQQWNDVFMIKYNSSGLPLWVKQVGGNQKDFAKGIAADNYGNVFLSGSFITSCNFDTISLSNAGYQEPFLAKYDSLGNIKWAINSGGNGAGEGICLDKANSIFVTGTFGGNMNFGGNPIYGIPNSMFLTKINDNSSLSIIESIKKNDNLILYPCPTTGIFQLTYTGDTKSHSLQIEVKDVVGKVVLSFIQKGPDIPFIKKIDLCDKPKGIYFVEIISGVQRITKKIVIE